MKRKKINTHFTLETRTIIENLLNEGKSVTEISRLTNRDRSNIAKEINKHKQLNFPSTFNNYHPCLKHDTCTSKGYECYLNCKNIEVKLCPKLTSSPHVCNGCTTKKNCRYVKHYYNAKEANLEYQNSWKNDRTGLHYTKEELSVLNNDFKMIVLNCKSVYHALIVINKRGFNFNLNTIYKQIEKDQLELKNSDLPRCRKKSKTKKIDTSYKRENIEGHTYEDYLLYKEQHEKAIEMQMDTVEGAKLNNAPVILTLNIVQIKFLFMFKINNQTNQEVCKCLTTFKKTIGDDIISKITEILLTDNGKEFIGLKELEQTLDNSNIFYCHPYCSYEKGAIENNHELIRRVIPKGINMGIYNQNDLNLLCSHINSLYRNELDGKCPFDLINDYIPIDKLEELGLKKIDEDKVLLIPSLLGDKNIDNIKRYLDDKEIKEANIKL